MQSVFSTVKRPTRWLIQYGSSKNLHVSWKGRWQQAGKSSMHFQHFLRCSHVMRNYIFEMSNLITFHIHVICEPNTSIKRTKSIHCFLNFLMSLVAPYLLPPPLISDNHLSSPGPLAPGKFSCRSFYSVISPTTKGVTSHLREDPCSLSSHLPHPQGSG